MNQEAEDRKKRWTRAEVETTLKEILMDALGVGEEKIVPEASLVHDLGAESIDFLDIGFRVQQTFGVEIPNKAIQEKVLRWRSLAELNRILEERYGARINPEEMKQLRTTSMPEVIRWLAEKQGITVQDGDAEKMAAELVNQLAHELESIGFKASLIDREGIMKLLLKNLNSPQIMEGMLRLLSVGALVDFITARAGSE
ncbi:MAG: acyl carrier protein [Candidatus Binatia bacterium]